MHPGQKNYFMRAYRDNLPNREREMREACFLMHLPYRGNGGLCKTRSYVVVVVNEGKADHCT